MTGSRTITLALLALLTTGAVVFAQEDQKSSDQAAPQTQPVAPEAKPADAMAETEAPADDPEVTKVVDLLLAKWNDHKSMSADLNIDMVADQGGRELVVKGTGRCEIQRTDDGEKVRFELIQNMKMGEGDSAMEMERKLITTDNGKVVYTMVEQMGQKQVVKSVPGRQNIPKFGGEHMFEALRAENKLALLPEDKVGDQEVYVIEATPKRPDPSMQITKSVLYFSKDSGAMLRMESFDPTGKKVQTITFDNVQMNLDLAADRFEFEVPEGVQVIDQTGN